ncbi:hypothetical protein BD626DRAFT_566468 [Schizophyllum amplum]|uniref:GST N-terminal domain-containing protein n=1 Tax=Schizophyllum amplum TaxID=97359 RepID=A0A550CLX7_9AGAR|nr:hypothetical protein BD626DRAFT_566468 [Auriculariopsis ampla]
MSPKLILYTFGGSVWASDMFNSSPHLAVLELNYGDAVELETEGENFKPEFLAKFSPFYSNSNGTLPTLETPGKTLADTTEVIEYLIENAPSKVKSGNAAFIKEIHDDKYDPNCKLLLARDDKELSAKANGFPAQFIVGRQRALQATAAFRTSTWAVPEDVKNGFFKQSQSVFENVLTYLYTILPKKLPDSGFLGGEVPGEDDFHLGAWLTRIALTCGAQSADDGLEKIAASFGKPLSPKVEAPGVLEGLERPIELEGGLQWGLH